MAKIIEPKHCDTAEDLLRVLSPFDPYWDSLGGIDSWYFRGQGDDAWGLEPSAMRVGKLVLRRPIGVSALYPVGTLAERLHAEQDVAYQFLDDCLAAGLPIPEDSQWHRSRPLKQVVFGPLMKSLYEGGMDWPFALERSLYALAQHHRVPTRLLDWTGNAFVAAYFAAVDVATALAMTGTAPPEMTGSNIAVFALRHLAFDYISPEPRNGSVAPPGYDRALVEVQAPYAENPNLRAQQGTFTLITFSTPRAPEDPTLPTIEEILKDWSTKALGAIDDGRLPFLIKFTTPHAQSQRLLQLLRKAHVWAGTVYPNYDAVRSGIVERSYWK